MMRWLQAHDARTNAATGGPGRAARVGLVGLALLSLSALRCAGSEVTIVIQDPNDLRVGAQWVEFDVFEGECPDKFALAGDDYPRPLRIQIVDDLEGEVLEAVGKLAAKSYGFAVLLRDPDCGIIGYGCATADLTTVREITLRINPAYTTEEGDPQPRGVCVAPEVCAVGRCVEENPEEEIPEEEGL